MHKGDIHYFFTEKFVSFSYLFYSMQHFCFKIALFLGCSNDLITRNHLVSRWNGIKREVQVKKEEECMSHRSHCRLCLSTARLINLRKGVMLYQSCHQCFHTNKWSNDFATSINYHTKSSHFSHHWTFIQINNIYGNFTTCFERFNLFPVLSCRWSLHSLARCNMKVLN